MASTVHCSPRANGIYEDILSIICVEDVQSHQMRTHTHVQALGSNVKDC
jgi:hypothetical protein